MELIFLRITIQGLNQAGGKLLVSWSELRYRGRTKNSGVQGEGIVHLTHKLQQKGKSEQVLDLFLASSDKGRSSALEERTLGFGTQN